MPRRGRTALVANSLQGGKIWSGRQDLNLGPLAPEWAEKVRATGATSFSGSRNAPNARSASWCVGTIWSPACGDGTAGVPR